MMNAGTQRLLELHQGRPESATAIVFGDALGEATHHGIAGDLLEHRVLGGLLVVLPIYLSVLLLAKTLSAIFGLLSPVTAAIPAGVQFRQVIAVLIVLAVCFVAGIVVRTGPACAPRMCSNAASSW